MPGEMSTTGGRLNQLRDLSYLLLIILDHGLEQVSETVLVAISGKSPRTCREHLRLLAHLGYLEHLPRPYGYRVLPLAYESFPMFRPASQAERQNVPLHQAAETVPAASPGEGRSPAQTNRQNMPDHDSGKTASPGEGQPSNQANRQNLPLSRAGGDGESNLINIKIPPIPPDLEDLRSPEELDSARQMLRTCGIGEPTRSRLLELECMTAEYIELWRQSLDKDPGPGRWNTGLLVLRLRSQEWPAERALSSSRSYKDGPYAAFINR